MRIEAENNAPEYKSTTFRENQKRDYRSEYDKIIYHLNITVAKGHQATMKMTYYYILYRIV